MEKESAAPEHAAELGMADWELLNAGDALTLWVNGTEHVTESARAHS